MTAMGRPPRIQFEGAFYHVYNRGVEKRAIFMDERDYRTFLHLLAEVVSEFQIRLIAYCLMKNHYHLFLQTLKANLQVAMKALQGEYAQYVNTRYSRVGPLFQGRYNSRLVAVDLYSFALARYIHRNPLEAELVEQITDYPWSSYPCYVGKLPRWSWLDTDWLLGQFDADPEIARQRFLQFHNETPPAAESQVLSSTGLLTSTRA